MPSLVAMWYISVHAKYEKDLTALLVRPDRFSAWVTVAKLERSRYGTILEALIRRCKRSVTIKALVMTYRIVGLS
jgi:hypothetical protein